MNARLRRRGVATVVRRTPGPALVFVSLVGWVAMVWLTVVGHASVGAELGSAASVAHSHLATGASSAAAAIVAPAHAASGLLIWSAMVLAMAPPMLWREIGRLWRGSLHRTRALSVAVFAAGYSVVWLLVAVVAVPLAGGLAVNAALIAVALASALLWQCSPLRQRALNSCHRAPALRTFGHKAVWDAASYGLRTGGACVATCGPIMVLVLLATDFHLIAMAAASLLLTAERYGAPLPPAWRPPFVLRRPRAQAAVMTPVVSIGTTPTIGGRARLRRAFP
jgi:hypothetical protein